MRIDFDKIVNSWNERNPENTLNKAKLAREMVSEGLFRTEIAALNMMRYNNNGKAKSIDLLMLTFLCEKFHIEPNDILQ